MAANQPKRWGLAGRIIGVTLAVGAVTVLTASVVAILGASRLAAQQTEARDQAALQIVDDAVLGRLGSVENIAESVAQAAATYRTAAAIDARITPMFDSWQGLVDRVMVAGRDGRIVTAFPASLETTAPMSDVAVRSAFAGAGGFRRVVGSNGSWAIWLTRQVLTPSGSPQVVLVRTGQSFLDDAVRAAAGSTDRLVMVLEDGVPLASTGTTQAALFDQASWEPLPGQAGTVAVTRNDAPKLVGYYADVRGVQGVDWRIVVLEPNNVVTRNTLEAVTPTILVLLLGGAFGVGAVLLVSERLVRPLKTLEHTAYRAANGSFVAPLAVSSGDEIGRVASAFNAVSLRLNALHDLAQLLASASQVDQVLDGILSAMRHIIGPGVVAVYLLDDECEWFIPARSRGVDLANIRRVAVGGRAVLPYALDQADVVARTLDGNALAAELPGMPSGRSLVLAAPLISAHERLGVIVALRRHGEPFSEAECEMVRTFTAQAATAVQNSRLFEAETQSLRVAEALRAAAERLVRPGSLADALDDVERLVDDLFDTSGSRFALFDRSALGVPASSDPGAEARLLGLVRREKAEGGASASVLHYGDDAASDEVIREFGAGALVLVPVAPESGHGAVLAVPLWRGKVGAREIELADALATEVALALENAFLYKRALVRAENLETVFRISQAVGSSLQVNVVLNRVLDVVQKILSADAVALMTYDQRKRAITTAIARGSVPADLITIELVPGEDVPGYVFSTGKPMTFNELGIAMDGVAGSASRQGMRSLLAVPLLARGRSIGVLMVFSSESGAFAEEDENVLQTFASQAALALDTARLYSREHDVATILQQSILPDALPEFAEIEAATVYQPAGADVEIGGDYYDLFRAPDGAIWLTIGDVCGKGVIAATKTSMIKYSVRAFVSAGMAPAAVLREVNRFVAEGGDASDIVTLWVGRLDPATSELCYSNGGHPAGVVCHTDGNLERAAPTGPLLGAVTNVVYGEKRLQLRSGDMVVLYTDGVSEARRGKEFFGERRIEEAVIEGGTADEIVRRLLTLVRRWVHGELRDDVALLAVALRADDGQHS